MLEVAEGLEGQNKRQKRMLEILQALMKDSGIVLDEKNIALAPAFWNDVEVELDSSGQLDVQIVHEIIWELYEAKFCLEMFLIERKMVPKPTGYGEEWEMAQEIWFKRERLVHCCWPGQAHRPQYSRPGFSQIGDNSSRLPFIKGLFSLVQAWPGPKPVKLSNPFPAEEDLVALREVEEILASYYIHTFLKSFQHPPTIPHVANPIRSIAASSLKL